MERKAASMAAIPEEKTEVCGVVDGVVDGVEEVGMYSMALIACSKA